MNLPNKFENHPINANNRASLCDYIKSSGGGTLPEELIELRVNALYDFLLDHTDVKVFNDSVYLYATDNCLTYEQYAEKEYYHDGSQEYRMILKFHVITKEEYERFAKNGTKENKPMVCPENAVHTKWLDKCSDYYYGWFEYTYKSFGSDQIGRFFCLFAKDFLKCFDYVRIQCYTWI